MITDLIAIGAGSIILLLILFISPLKKKKKKIVYIVAVSMVVAILFNYIKNLLTIEFATSASLLLLLCTAYLLTRYGSVDKDKDNRPDAGFKAEVAASVLHATNDEDPQKRAASSNNPIGTMSQNKIDEFIRSLTRKKDSKNDEVQEDDSAETTVDNSTPITEVVKAEGSHIEIPQISTIQLSEGNSVEEEKPFDSPPKEAIMEEENTKFAHQIESDWVIGTSEKKEQEDDVGSDGSVGLDVSILSDISINPSSGIESDADIQSDASPESDVSIESNDNLETIGSNGSNTGNDMNVDEGSPVIESNFDINFNAGVEPEIDIVPNEASQLDESSANSLGFNLSEIDFEEDTPVEEEKNVNPNLETVQMLYDITIEPNKIEETENSQSKSVESKPDYMIYDIGDINKEESENDSTNDSLNVAVESEEHIARKQDKINPAQPYVEDDKDLSDEDVLIKKRKAIFAQLEEDIF